MKSLLTPIEKPFVWMFRIPEGATVEISGPPAVTEHDAREFLDYALAAASLLSGRGRRPAGLDSHSALKLHRIM